MKKIFVVIAVVTILLIGASVTFAAVTAKTPAEIVAGLTGKTVDQVMDARSDGESYGAQAAEADKLSEFKDLRLEQFQLVLAERVTANEITQAQADELYENMASRIATCTGDGLGQGNGSGLGQGNGSGLGECDGSGLGQGNQGSGKGNGTGFGKGSCGN